ncbi:Domain of uncharacterised function (DUF2825) [Escherichia coli]|nr:Domain of uncharacterised function (DUF2825) [Escherichia coli]
MSRLPDRFIPAGAGNTVVRASGRFYVAVYPRWRGEHSSRVINDDSVSGLSPLARGTRTQYHGVLRPRRFIPAGAGNTHPCRRLYVCGAVYPRWRGEHARICAHGAHFWRFIPAGAGNTRSMAHRIQTLTVYPRWRGEHSSLSSLFSVPNGLSPLARGTRGGNTRRSFGRRFIPAGAGNTKILRASSGHGPVYPRWRGEHTAVCVAVKMMFGLSPLARGTH